MFPDCGSNFHDEVESNKRVGLLRLIVEKESMRVYGFKNESKSRCSGESIFG